MGQSCIQSGPIYARLTSGHNFSQAHRQYVSESVEEWSAVRQQIDGNVRTSSPGPGFDGDAVFTNEVSPHYMRLFTAIDLPGAVREHCARLQTTGALEARWSPADQFHVTVRFIGDVDPEQADEYESALRGIDAPRADCIPYGLDVLPSRRNPNVLVVGLERSASLMDVYRAVSEALESRGVEPETRKYRPHVTLARLKDPSPARVQQVLDDADRPPPSFQADTIHLYESTLTDDGALHSRRASFPLGK